MPSVSWKFLGFVNCLQSSLKPQVLGTVVSFKGKDSGIISYRSTLTKDFMTAFKKKIMILHDIFEIEAYLSTTF